MIGLDILLTHAELAAFSLLAFLGFASCLLPMGQISFWVATKTIGK